MKKDSRNFSSDSMQLRFENGIDLPGNARACTTIIMLVTFWLSFHLESTSNYRFSVVLLLVTGCVEASHPCARTLSWLRDLVGFSSSLSQLVWD